MRTPPLLADFIHHRVCKPICEKLLTLPERDRACKQFCVKFLPLPKHEKDNALFAGAVSRILHRVTIFIYLSAFRRRFCCFCHCSSSLMMVSSMRFGV